jgi:hypothetical protein
MLFVAAAMFAFPADYDLQYWGSIALHCMTKYYPAANIDPTAHPMATEEMWILPLWAIQNQQNEESVAHRALEALYEMWKELCWQEAGELARFFLRIGVHAWIENAKSRHRTSANVLHFYSRLRDMLLDSSRLEKWPDSAPEDELKHVWRPSAAALADGGASLPRPRLPMVVIVHGRIQKAVMTSSKEHMCSGFDDGSIGVWRCHDRQFVCRIGGTPFGPVESKPMTVEELAAPLSGAVATVALNRSMICISGRRNRRCATSFFCTPCALHVLTG